MRRPQAESTSEIRRGNSPTADVCSKAVGKGFPWGLAESQYWALKEAQGGVRAMAIAISGPELKQLTEIELMGHLFRGAGFSATWDQPEAAWALGCEETVERL